MKYLLYSFFFLSLICFDFGIKTYEMFHTNAESIELVSKNKTEKEMEDVDEVDKLLGGVLRSNVSNEFGKRDFSQLFYSDEQFNGEIPEPPPDQST